MYAVFIFGRPLEQAWGSRRFLFYYFFTGIGAGICVLALNAFIGGPNYYIATIGASGAVFGILLAFGIMYPNVELYLLFFPFPIKAKYFVMGYGAIEIFFLFKSGGQGPVSHIGHVGGLIFGLLYFFFQRQRGITFKSKLIRAKVEKNRNQDSIRKVKQVGTHVKVKETNRDSLLKILKKVQSGGVESLTDDEYQHVRYLEIMHADSQNMCPDEDFDDADTYCSKCENYETCIIREIRKYI
jgi:hypothetical protein